MTTRDATPQSIGARLRAAREQCGLSQSQVASMLKVHRPTISQIESGDRSVKAPEITQFAKIYGVKDSWILTGDSGNGAHQDPRLELAARELSKLKSEDLDKLLSLLSRLRSTKESSS